MFEPRFIRGALQIFADSTAQQTPELIGRMRIVAAGGERSVARQASQDEQPCVGSGDRRQTGFDAQQ